MAEVFKEKTVKIHEATDKPIFDVMQEIAGISTDTKPTNVATGSVFFETDTTKIYIYDGENEQWNEVTCGSGGGGGGGDGDTLIHKTTFKIKNSLEEGNISVGGCFGAMINYCQIITPGIVYAEVGENGYAIDMTTLPLINAGETQIFDLYYITSTLANPPQIGVIVTLNPDGNTITSENMTHMTDGGIHAYVVTDITANSVMEIEITRSVS